MTRPLTLLEMADWYDEQTTGPLDMAQARYYRAAHAVIQEARKIRKPYFLTVEMEEALAAYEAAAKGEEYSGHNDLPPDLPPWIPEP